MDTREKIRELSVLREMLQTGSWVIVPGLFDPLTAVQAERISQLKENGNQLLAIVLSPPGRLLAAEARAALMAGLRDVDAVVVANGEAWRQLIPQGANVTVRDDAAGERARSAEFVEFVRARQRSAEAKV